MTLSTWIPQLYPTTSQRLVETLRLSEQQMQKSFEAAKKVAEFAETIEGDVSDLNRSLKSSKGALSVLGKSASDINSFSDKFVSGVTELTQFQGEIWVLYQQMVADSKVFQESVKDSIGRSDQLQRKIIEHLDQQSAQIASVLGGLRSYEEAYVKDRHEIDAKLQEVLTAARAAFGDIGERNKEIVVALGVPLREDLIKQLSQVEETLNVQLRGIQDRFASFDAPIGEAARQIEGSLETVVKRTEKLTRELQEGFFQQNQTNKEQLKELNQVNKKVPNLLEQLSLSTESHGKHAQALSETIKSLQDQVSSLDTAIGGLNKTISVPHSDNEDIGAIQAGAILLELFKNDQRNNELAKTLLAEISNLRRDIGTLQPNGGHATQTFGSRIRHPFAASKEADRSSDNQRAAGEQAAGVHDSSKLRPNLDPTESTRSRTQFTQSEPRSTIAIFREPNPKTESWLSRAWSRIWRR